MFTGLVETSGTVTKVIKAGKGIALAVSPVSPFDVALGDSVSVNGVCLTVVRHNGDISFDVSPETLKSTSLGALHIGDRVNLERALRLTDRLGGHIVSGHVDAIGTITDKKQGGEYTFYTIEAPQEVLKYTVKKGSIAVDGISLTVVDVDRRSFRVAIIPHTEKATTIGDKAAGSRVNLEADIIGKYVEKMMGSRENSSGLLDLLKEKGYVNE